MVQSLAKNNYIFFKKLEFVKYTRNFLFLVIFLLNHTRSGFTQDLLFDYRLVQERCDGGDAIKRMTPEERMVLMKKTLKKSNKLTQKLLRKLDREWDEVFKEDDGNYY